MTDTFRVFVCGTYRDLTPERKAVMKAITKMRLQHDSMEVFGARHNRPLQTCLDEVRRSDILVVIVGHLYGSVSEDAGVSFTEAEYEEGHGLLKPCLVYFRDDQVPVLPKHVESDPKKIQLLSSFKKRLQSRHTIGTFQGLSDLPVQVAADLAQQIQLMTVRKETGVREQASILRENVRQWNLWRAQNSETIPDLHGADLSGLDLTNADLSRVSLAGANMSDSTLVSVNLTDADLSGTNFSGATFGGTVLVAVDLSTSKGLARTTHPAPSSIGLDTFYKSGAGGIPEEFLLSAGIPRDFLDHLPLGLGHPIQFYSVFLSHSSKDDDFARRLHADLQSAKVRVWFVPEDMKIGDRIRESIYESIRLYDKLIVVLSENSVASDWVETEVETALEQERERKATVLFPIRLDDAVFTAGGSWAPSLKRSRHIGDFTNWKDFDQYRRAVDRLLQDLQVDV